MIIGFSDPVSRWIVLAVLLAIALGILALLWLIFRAVCRKLGVRQRTQTVIAVIFVVLLCGGGIEIWRDKLDDLEQSCNSEFMKSERASGASELDIRKHVNLWKGWSNMWGYTEPYVDPKVMLWIWFPHEGRKHYTQVTCHFIKISGSGEPPQLRFDKLEIQEPSWP
jgi:hypothetical protein